MITVGFPGVVWRSKSEVLDQPISNSRRLTAEWATGL